MPDVFDRALDVVFRRFGTAGVYTPPAGAAVAVTVLSDREDAEATGFAPTKLRGTKASFQVRASEVAAPVKGAALSVGGSTFAVKDAYCRDPDRRVFILDCIPS